MLVLKSLKSWTYLLFGGSYNFCSLVLHQMEHPNIFLSLRKYFLFKIIFLQVSMLFDLVQTVKIDDISELKRHADFTVKV